MTAEPMTADRAASAHLARIASAQSRISTLEDELDVLGKQSLAKKREHTAATKQLRDLVEQAAGIQALALPFGGVS